MVIQGETTQAKPPIFVLRPILDTAELFDFLRLRFIRYLGVNQITRDRISPTALEVDEYDTHSIPMVTLQVNEGFEPTVTTFGVRLITDTEQPTYIRMFERVLTTHGDDLLQKLFRTDPSEPFIAEEVFPEQVRKIASQTPGRIAEYSRFVAHPAYEGTMGLNIQTVRALHAMARLQGVSVSFCLCDLDHEKPYQRLHKIDDRIPGTDIIPHTRVNGKDSVGMVNFLGKFDADDPYSQQVQAIERSLAKRGMACYCGNKKCYLENFPTIDACLRGEINGFKDGRLLERRN